MTHAISMTNADNNVFRARFNHSDIEKLTLKDAKNKYYLPPVTNPKVARILVEKFSHASEEKNSSFEFKIEARQIIVSIDDKDIIFSEYAVRPNTLSITNSDNYTLRAIINNDRFERLSLKGPDKKYLFPIETFNAETSLFLIKKLQKALRQKDPFKVEIDDTKVIAIGFEEGFIAFTKYASRSNDNPRGEYFEEIYTGWGPKKKKIFAIGACTAILGVTVAAAAAAPLVTCAAVAKIALGVLGTMWAGSGVAGMHYAAKTNEHEINGKDLIDASSKGAVCGMVGGMIAVPGSVLGGPYVALAAQATASVASETTNKCLSDEKMTKKDVLISAAAGVTGAGIAFVAGVGMSSYTNEIVKKSGTFAAMGIGAAQGGAIGGISSFSSTVANILATKKIEGKQLYLKELIDVLRMNGFNLVLSIGLGAVGGATYNGVQQFKLRRAQENFVLKEILKRKEGNVSDSEMAEVSSAVEDLIKNLDNESLNKLAEMFEYDNTHPRPKPNNKHTQEQNIEKTEVEVPGPTQEEISAVSQEEAPVATMPSNELQHQEAIEQFESSLKHNQAYHEKIGAPIKLFKGILYDLYEKLIGQLIGTGSLTLEMMAKIQNIMVSGIEYAFGKEISSCLGHKRPCVAIDNTGKVLQILTNPTEIAQAIFEGHSIGLQGKRGLEIKISGVKAYQDRYQQYIRLGGAPSNAAPAPVTPTLAPVVPVPTLAPEEPISITISAAPTQASAIPATIENSVSQEQQMISHWGYFQNNSSSHKNRQLKVSPPSVRTQTIKSKSNDQEKGADQEFERRSVSDFTNQYSL